jgi:mono/diheme cytochrome c family protein/plastocyanin
MDTGAPRTDRGQQRRISLMILLMLALVGASLVYGLLDPGRASDAAERQKEEAATRGAELFAKNCVTCHGISGQGVIGPRLNKPENRQGDTATLDKLRDLYKKTITCGRTGTLMPAWGQSESGPLNDFQISQLVTLVTTDGPEGDSEKYWKLVEEDWHTLNPSLAEPVIPTGLQPNTGACGQHTPTPVPTGSATGTATAEPSGTPAPPQTSFTLVATDNHFDLSNMVVPAGQEVTVTFQNNGSSIHNFHIPDLTVTGAPLPAGQSETVTFTAPAAGTLNFLCDFHPSEMTGTITAQ